MIQQISNGEQFGSIRSKLNLVINSINTSLGLEGSQYIFVSANGTDIENSIELQQAYNQAKTMSPTASNRITIIAAPGNYNFGTSPFVMDTEYIDLVSLDGNRSIVFNSTYENYNEETHIQSNYEFKGCINVFSNNTFVKGVVSPVFNVGNDLDSIIIENCKGGDYSLNIPILSGKFIDCEMGIGSFNGELVSGEFINCIAGDYSFCGGISGYPSTVNNFYIFSTNIVISGILKNCQAGIFIWFLLILLWYSIWDIYRL